MRKLYSIKQAAMACGVTPRTLRYYETLGLFKPEKIDELTQYRYYSSVDITRIILILNLRDASIPLAEIAKYLNGTTTIKNALQMLYNQKEAIEHSIAALKIHDTPVDSLKPEIITVPERLCLVKKIIAKDFSDAASSYWDFLNECILSGKCLINKHISFTEFPPEAFNETGLLLTNFPMSFCIPVDPNNPPKGSVIYPKCKAVAVNYRGPYEGLEKAYNVLFSFMDEHKLIQNGNPQEMYIEAENNSKLTKDHYITRIIIPISL